MYGYILVHPFCPLRRLFLPGCNSSLNGQRVNLTHFDYQVSANIVLLLENNASMLHGVILELGLSKCIWLYKPTEEKPIVEHVGFHGWLP